MICARIEDFGVWVFITSTPLLEHVKSNTRSNFFKYSIVFLNLRKLPSTSELLDWIGVLLKAGITIDELKRGVPFLGVLIKKEKDLEIALSKAKFPT